MARITDLRTASVRAANCEALATYCFLGGKVAGTVSTFHASWDSADKIANRLTFGDMHFDGACVYLSTVEILELPL